LRFNQQGSFDQPEMPINQIPQDFPLLHHAPGEFTEALHEAAQIVTLPAATTICQQGNQCQQLPIVINGQARVYKLAESGREITLYRIGPGESCVLTASCIMSDIVFPAIAVTETDTTGMVIPAANVVDWFDRFPHWRRFVFELVSKRMSDILTVIEEVAFRRMDSRVANYLLSRADADDMLKMTHQKSADDLGTAREVITRLLKDFESRQWIKTGRGVLQIIEREKLEGL
jgi:CRP/FNR family transcriptional regulator